MIRKKIMPLEGGEFLRRFLLHILPKGFMRIRHYGYLANRVRVEQLKKIRDWISEDKPEKLMQRLMPATIPVEAAMSCPVCKTGRLFLSGVILSEKERRQMLWVK
jgi:hypothetical protein